ncbi:MAG TPA: MlaD family protein [Gemmatimonadales bacterium]|jgi:phospholipid/cholesterol/gamma-HCH transport system substrate-binding protein|nr:MlaD family protein [Gemmatimonadales bacterium]
MKRTNEFAVGLAVLLALALVVAGALWLSETDVNQKKMTATARFRTVGGLGVGAPVTLRGVKVGRVEAIRLARDEWVETEFSIDRAVELPAKPAVISASASLFGEWSANIIAYDPPPADPNLRDALAESDRAGGSAWPGATLPDIGQLTAQASRIAGDVGVVTQRISQAFDSTALRNLQQSVKDLAVISTRLVGFADAQTSRIDRVSRNVATTSDAFAGVAKTFESAVARLDTATSDNQLKDILANGRSSSQDIRQAAADLRSVMAAAKANETSLVRVLQQADSLMTRIQQGNGTLGMLATDSTLYRETTATVIQFRELLTDIQEHPKKYLKISVF